jgi:myo-inositol-1(or 4)-monophosphatase
VAVSFGDAYVSLRPKSEWDICAGVALVLAAGGRVTDLSGRDFSFNQAQVEASGVVAANPTLHRELMRVVGRKWCDVRVEGRRVCEWALFPWMN